MPVKGEKEEAYTAEKKKDGDEEDGDILPFENIVETGSLVINKKVIGGYWSIGCEVPFVPPINDEYNKKELFFLWVKFLSFQNQVFLSV